jgi:hypothetical protein
LQIPLFTKVSPFPVATLYLFLSGDENLRFSYFPLPFCFCQVMKTCSASWRISYFPLLLFLRRGDSLAGGKGSPLVKKFGSFKNQNRSDENRSDF